MTEKPLVSGILAVSEALLGLGCSGQFDLLVPGQTAQALDNLFVGDIPGMGLRRLNVFVPGGQIAIRSQAEFDRLEELLDSARGQGESLIQQNATLRAERDQLAQRLEEVTKERDALLAKFDQVMRESIDRRHRGEDLEAALAEQRARADKAEKERDEYNLAHGDVVVAAVKDGELFRVERDALRDERDKWKTAHTEAEQAFEQIISEQRAELARTKAERDAYRKAKQENDDRFMCERDDALAELARVKADNKELEGALRSLKNEASGFVSMAEPATHGHTNIAVLRRKIEDANEVLLAAAQSFCVENKLQARLASVERQAAAMREALEEVRYDNHALYLDPNVTDSINAALASDAGREFVPRAELEAMEEALLAVRRGTLTTVLHTEFESAVPSHREMAKLMRIKAKPEMELVEKALGLAPPTAASAELESSKSASKPERTSELSKPRVPEPADKVSRAASVLVDEPLPKTEPERLTEVRRRSTEAQRIMDERCTRPNCDGSVHPIDPPPVVTLPRAQVEAVREALEQVPLAFEARSPGFDWGAFQEKRTAALAICNAVLKEKP